MPVLKKKKTNIFFSPIFFLVCFKNLWMCSNTHKVTIFIKEQKNTHTHTRTHCFTPAAQQSSSFFTLLALAKSIVWIFWQCSKNTLKCRLGFAEGKPNEQNKTQTHLLDLSVKNKTLTKPVFFCFSYFFPLQKPKQNNILCTNLDFLQILKLKKSSNNTKFNKKKTQGHKTKTSQQLVLPCKSNTQCLIKNTLLPPSLKVSNINPETCPP